MAARKEEQADTPTSKEKLQSPKNVPCSICLDAVESAGERSIARLKCGHHFHLDCIGSAFNAKGAMQCPNCRRVEGGQWLFASGCYLQQQQVSRNSVPDEDYAYAEMLYSLYRPDEHLTHSSRRPSYGAYHQNSIESDYPSSTNRYSGRVELPPQNVHLNEIARPLPSDLDALHASRMYIRSSQALTIQRAQFHGNVLPNSHTLEGPMPRQHRMDDDDFVFRGQPASNHRYAINRGPGDGHRELAFRILSLASVGHVEQTAGSRVQDVRYLQSGSEAYNTRRAGAYSSDAPPSEDWGSSHESVHRGLGNAYGGDAHLHPLNRAGGSHGYYNGYPLGARVPWI